MNLHVEIKSSVLHESTNQSDKTILLEWGDHILAEISMDQGSNVMLVVDYGDGKTENDFVSNWTNDAVIQKHHQYESLGFFDVRVQVKNSANDSTKAAKCAVYDNVKYVDFDIPNVATSGFLEVKFLRSDNASSTLGTTIILDFGDRQAKVTETDFTVGHLFNHTYSKAGVYELSASLNNPISASKITEWISVIDKLDGVKIIINDGKEGLVVENEMLVEFSATIGSNVTIEYYFGDDNVREQSVGGEFLELHSSACNHVDKILTQQIINTGISTLPVLVSNPINTGQ